MMSTPGEKCKGVCTLAATASALRRAFEPRDSAWGTFAQRDSHAGENLCPCALTCSSKGEMREYALGGAWEAAHLAGRADADHIRQGLFGIRQRILLQSEGPFLPIFIDAGESEHLAVEYRVHGWSEKLSCENRLREVL